MTEGHDYIEIGILPDLNRHEEEPAHGLFQLIPPTFKTMNAADYRAITWPRQYGKASALRRVEKLKNYFASLQENWEAIQLRAKLAAHFEEQAWQHLEQSTALWITEPPKPIIYISKITHTWK